jgi:anaerobic magnesium-protoporphyrin IX monomethyl ester cyclase
MRIEYTKGERASKELILLNRQSFEATSGRKMKVMLIFPPDWFPSEPYLSLPSLTAVLRQAGHQVVQKDINLEMWDWYFSEDFLKKVLRRVPQQLDRLRKLAKKRELEEWEQDLQLTLCDLTRQRIDDLIKKAEKAKAIIRGEVFYEIDQLEWAIHVFREVTSVISMVYAPARICMPPMETDLSYKVFVSHEVMDAVNDTQVNIYRDVFEHLGEAGDRGGAAGRGRHLDRLAAADVFLHDLLCPHQAALSQHPCDHRRQHGDASARCAPAVAAVSILRQCRGL